MTQAVTAVSPRIPAPARALRATAPQSATVAQSAATAPASAPAQAPAADAVALGSDAALTQWARSRFMRIPTMGRPALEAMAAEALEKTRTPGLGAQAQGILWLARGGALGQLSLTKVERKANGKAAYEALERAAALAPTDRDVCQAYARSMYAISDRNFFVRKVVTSVLGMDLKANMKKANALLAQFPNDPTAQLVRERLADKVDDKATMKDARAHLDRMASHDPKVVQDARRKLDGDKGMAKAAEADVK